MRNRVRMAASGIIAFWAALAIPAQAASPKLLDCPMRDAPFSLESPLIDILLSDAAKGVIEARRPARSPRSRLS